MNKRVLVLGGGVQQVILVEAAKRKGFDVFVSDWFKVHPCQKIADGSRQIDTFSVEENLDYAKDKNVNYILTSGTDQPVYTAAVVSENLKLPHPINSYQAEMVTNKLYMKAIFAENDIPSSKYITGSHYNDFQTGSMNFPCVVKPVDSQGQRGISVITQDTPEDVVRKKIDAARNFSRRNLTIIEEFYEGIEFTINCWVKDGVPYILMLNDRLHFNDSIVLGICKQHRFPSQAINTNQKKSETDRILKKIVSVFKIKDGPLYIQMIDGSEGIKVVEIGYRVGGGFEGYFIPIMTSVDIVDLYLDLVTTGKNNYKQDDYRLHYSHGSICFLFSHPGEICKIKMPDNFSNYGQIFVKEGEIIESVKNATSRIGYFIVTGKNYDEYVRNLHEIEKGMSLLDASGEELIYHSLYE